MGAFEHRDDCCKIDLKCQDIHDWAHICLRLLTQNDLHDAHDLGNKIIEMLNELPQTNNAIKFVAMFEVLSVGADILDQDMRHLSGGTVTIH